MSNFISTCERCREDFAGNLYRVLSEDKDGEKLLDMVVCRGCYIEASQLGLDTAEVEIGRVVLQ
ncbi:MAG: hypothetical protein ACREP3_16570 [Candidatus Binatia bacterium]